LRYKRFSKIDLQNGGFFSVKNILIKKSDKNKSFDIETFWMFLFGSELWIFHKLGSRKPQGWPAQNVRTVTSCIYSLNFRETRGAPEELLWYLDSASLNYTETDTLVLAFWLAETCVIGKSSMDWKKNRFLGFYFEKSENLKL
jgi:hypothetical protein